MSLTLISAIALNEVMKYKTRVRENDEAEELDTNELLENVDSLSRVVASQNCDIERLNDVIMIYDRELRSLKS